MVMMVLASLLWQASPFVAERQAAKGGADGKKYGEFVW
jgi:hypothetical protein